MWYILHIWHIEVKKLIFTGINFREFLKKTRNLILVIIMKICYIAKLEALIRIRPVYSFLKLRKIRERTVDFLTRVRH